MSRGAPASRQSATLEDVAGGFGDRLGSPRNPVDAAGRRERPWLLAPIDLQAIKASGVTFVVSLLERVIEEQAKGSPEKAAAIRNDIDQLIGEDLSKLVPGSPQAMQVKQALIAKGVWSQYLEVGIGPDAEIFTKSQPMSAVGPGADIGILSTSTWNNPEPEIAVVVSSSGRDRRRDARQRRQPARRRRALGVCCSARPRTTMPPARSVRSSACSTRASPSTTSSRRRSG